MKWIIDIPDEWKIRIEHNRRPDSIECGQLVESIWKGEILLKGHGRLIDADILETYVYEIPDKYCSGRQVVDYDVIKDAPTIIEADEEDKND